jgi:hypothetical protein
MRYSCHRLQGDDLEIYKGSSCFDPMRSAFHLNYRPSSAACQMPPCFLNSLCQSSATTFRSFSYTSYNPLQTVYPAISPHSSRCSCRKRISPPAVRGRRAKPWKPTGRGRTRCSLNTRGASHAGRRGLMPPRWDAVHD